MKNLEEIWEEIIEFGIATNEEIELITCINGYSLDTLNSIIYTRTGYRTIDQYKEYEI